MHDVEVEIDGKPVKFVYKPLKYGKYHDILSKCVNVKISANNPNNNGDIDLFKFRYLVTEESFTFPAGIKIGDLPIDVGNQLEALAMEAIGMGDAPSFQE